jgi:dephospho-CoA kinase
LRKITVTGGISCGKSSVCHLFQKLGAYVVSADKIVHQLLSPETNLGQDVIKLIGPDIVEDNKINRSKIAQKVFKQPALLKALEDLLHPAVLHEIENEYQRVKKEDGAALFVAEVPLLFEIGAEHLFDCTIAVVADKDLCKQRFIESTGYDEAEFEKRSSRQFSMEKKAQKADFVIFNNGSIEEMGKEVQKIFNSLTR